MKRYHIAQFGSFDVESMGDSLFPKALSYGLQKNIACEIELFSMNECEKPYSENSHIYAFEQFAARHAEKLFDAVVLGGGEFLHFRQIRFQKDGVEKPYPGGYLWVKPIEMAREHGIPVMMNCVGVPHDLTKQQQCKIREYFTDMKSITVRDEYSAHRLKAAGIDDVVCVADNLWYMNEMYPKQELAKLRKELEIRTGRDFSTPYILVQYGTTRNCKAMAEQLQLISKKTGYRVCLMPVNYCHEDRIGMELLAEQGSGAFEKITDYFQPEEMMAVISGAKAFFGTSLHGNLTAASYDVPFVGIDMYPSFVSKMDGIFKMIDCERYLVPDERGLAAAFFARKNDLEAGLRIPERIIEIQKKLDLHFMRMADLLKGAAVENG